MASDFRPFLATLESSAPAGGGTAFAPITAPAPTPAPSPPAPAAPSNAAKCQEVRVELKREGDRVKEIRIHCKCGEVIELACEF